MAKKHDITMEEAQRKLRDKLDELYWSMSRLPDPGLIVDVIDNDLEELVTRGLDLEYIIHSDQVQAEVDEALDARLEADRARMVNEWNTLRARRA